MRGAAVLVVVVLLAGCSGGGEGGGPDPTPTATASFSTSTGPKTTSTGLPFVATDEMDLTLTLAAGGLVHRIRLVAFDDFSIDQVRGPQTDDGDGPGGGGGNDDAPEEFGIAVVPQDGSPRTMGPCGDAAQSGVWDGRTHAGAPQIDLPAGLYDLWAWTSISAALVLEINGGGPATNLTMQAHNWTAATSVVSVTKSGPAQTTADFSHPVSVADAALILAGFTPPNGYPDEQAALAIESGGATCGAGEPGGGGGGFGGGFGGSGLSAGAFVGPGEATIEGTYSAMLSPAGEPTARLVVVTPV